MATVFKQRGRNTYDAKVKLWNEGKQRWMWTKKPTHATDEASALSIANLLEKASGEAKKGQMSRKKAEDLVQSVLQLAGVPWGIKATILLEYGDKYSRAAAARHKDPAKAKPLIHWDRFKEWAGEKIKWPMENWNKDMFQDYYAHLLAELSERTANDHIASLRQMFAKAEKEGRLKGNPAALVDKGSANSVEKDVFHRTEIARLLKSMRNKRERSWICLTLFGWHTGHRIQDMLSLTSQNLAHKASVGDIITFQPGKKEDSGGRAVTLPLPRYLAKMLKGLKDFSAIHGADNRNGKVSSAFVEWMVNASIDPLYVDREKRRVPLKSYHSFRHTLTSRLAKANVEKGLEALVTDHDSPQMQRHYSHAEVVSIAEALKKARRV